MRSVDFSSVYSDLHNENAGLIDKAGTSNRNKKTILERLRNFLFISKYVDEMGGITMTGQLGRHIGQIEIYYSADIGEGLKINHGVGTVIGARCKLGKNCMIHQNCTIGDRNGGRPTIGNNVVIYAGAMILGNVIIGDNCIIGANSVVTKSFPNNCVLVGSPARNVNKYE